MPKDISQSPYFARLEAHKILGYVAQCQFNCSDVERKLEEKIQYYLDIIKQLQHSNRRLDNKLIEIQEICNDY